MADYVSQGGINIGAATRAANNGLATGVWNPAKSSNARIYERSWAPGPNYKWGDEGAGPRLRGSLTALAEETYSIGGAPLRRRRFDFIYNPTTIQTKYSVDTSGYPVQGQVAIAGQKPYGVTSQTVSWQMMINRTYEVTYDQKRGSMGAASDAQALEYLLGAYDGIGIQAVEILAIFGVNKPGQVFGYVGFISDLSVEYTQFSNRMIPMVAVVNISLERKVYGDAAETGGGSGVYSETARVETAKSTQNYGIGVPNFSG